MSCGRTRPAGAGRGQADGRSFQQRARRALAARLTAGGWRQHAPPPISLARVRPCLPFQPASPARLPAALRAPHLGCPGRQALAGLQVPPLLLRLPHVGWVQVVGLAAEQRNGGRTGQSKGRAGRAWLRLGERRTAGAGTVCAGGAAGMQVSVSSLLLYPPGVPTDPPSSSGSQTARP